MAVNSWFRVNPSWLVLFSDSIHEPTPLGPSAFRIPFFQHKIVDLSLLYNSPKLTCFVFRFKSRTNSSGTKCLPNSFFSAQNRRPGLRLFFSPIIQLTQALFSF